MTRIVINVISPAAAHGLPSLRPGRRGSRQRAPRQLRFALDAGGAVRALPRRRPGVLWGDY